MSRILVTGASGFIGRYVVMRLARLAHDVVAVGFRKKPTFDVDGLPGSIVPIQVDLNNSETDFYRLFGRPEIVVHLAWEGLPNYEEAFHFERNLVSNYRFLSGLIREGVKDLSVAGTCLEYGKKDGALSEEMIGEPSTAYAMAKDCLRRFLVQLKRRHDFSMKWIRIFYTYGDGQSKTSLFEQLKAAIASGKRSFDMSTGDQLRDYLPVEVLADYFAEVALQTKEEGIINCCSGEPVSVRSMAERIVDQLKADIELKFGAIGYVPYEGRAFWGDPMKLRRVISAPGKGTA